MLVLLGFVATSWIITITLSAADATVHLLENPYLPAFLDGHAVAITVVMLLILGGVFLLGFSEAVTVAIPLVAVFLLPERDDHRDRDRRSLHHPRRVLHLDRCADLRTAAVSAGSSGPALLAFPLLVLGLSGFETGREHDAAGRRQRRYAGGAAGQSRIRNTRKLLTVAALIMSVYLLGSSFVTTVLIPAGGVRSRRRRERPGSGVPRPRTARRRRSAPSTTSAAS